MLLDVHLDNGFISQSDGNILVPTRQINREQQGFYCHDIHQVPLELSTWGSYKLQTMINTYM